MVWRVYVTPMAELNTWQASCQVFKVREGASFRGCGKASVDNAPDLGAAGAAIGSRTHRLADGFDAVAAAAHRGDDLVDTDAEAGTDDGAGIWRIRPRAAGDEREALAQIDVFGGK